MTTLAQARTSVRGRLDDQAYSTDDDLDSWINEACRDVARSTLSLRDTTTISVTLPSTSTYTLPTDCIQVHNVEFVRTGENQIHPLDPTRITPAEAMGWTNQDASGIPQLYFTWGFTGSAQLYVWPKSSDAGTLTVWYYRLPATASTPTAELEIPNGWDDLVYDYCEYRARLRDGDARWRDIKEQYQAKLMDHFNVTRDMHDQPNYISTGTSGGNWWEFDPTEGW